MKFKFIPMGVALIMLFTLLSGCTSISGTEKKEEKKTLMELAPAMASVENGNGCASIYELCNSKMKCIDSDKDFNLAFQYSYSDKVYAMLKFIDNGSNLNRNALSVKSANVDFDIDRLYSIIDFKLSPRGSYIAYRGYKSDDLSSIENISIFDLESGRDLEFKSNVLISGDLYDFIDEHRLIYYGVSDDKISQGIFQYDMEDGTEKLLYEIKDGYLTYMQRISEDEIIVLQQNGEKSEVNIINLKSKTNKVLSHDIQKISSSLSINGSIYMCAQKQGGKSEIYLCEKGSVKRMTYDFPKNIYDESYLANDDEGNVYFVGYDDKKDEGNIYCIKNDNSINLVSDKDGAYKIYKNTSYYDK